QDDRWEKQRSGVMMVLHCRSRASPVRSSLGKRVRRHATPNWVNVVNQRIEPDEPSKSRPSALTHSVDSQELSNVSCWAHGSDSMCDCQRCRPGTVASDCG